MGRTRLCGRRARSRTAGRIRLEGWSIQSVCRHRRARRHHPLHRRLSPRQRRSFRFPEKMLFPICRRMGQVRQCLRHSLPRVLLPRQLLRTERGRRPRRMRAVSMMRVVRVVRTPVLRVPAVRVRVAMMQGVGIRLRLRETRLRHRNVGERSYRRWRGRLQMSVRPRILRSQSFI